jgi:6-phosphogluconolactonase
MIVGTSRWRDTRRMNKLFAYVGCYTTLERRGRGNGINVYRVDRRSGAFTHIQHLGGLENPSFLAIDASGRHLYSVHGDRSEATSFAVDPRTGHLRLLNRQPTGGYNPIHLTFDKTGRFLVISNYGTDSTTVLPIGKDGTLGPYSTLTTVAGALGPHRSEQKNVRPHHNPLDRTGRYFFLPCKGGDVVVAYRLDRKHGVLVEVSRVPTRPGAGPRHIDFHPRRAFAYVINELDSTITTYRQDGAKLTPLQVVPSTPSDFTGYSTGAEIAVDRMGHNVYVSNRGHNSVGVFAIDPVKGSLAPKQWVPTKGTVPRFFAFDPAQRFLYVANQGSDTIFGYRVGANGKLSPTSIKVNVGSPACIVFCSGET